MKQTLLVCDFSLKRWHNGYRLKCSSPTGVRTRVAYPNDDDYLGYDLRLWLRTQCRNCLNQRNTKILVCLKTLTTKFGSKPDLKPFRREEEDFR